MSARPAGVLMEYAEEPKEGRGYPLLRVAQSVRSARWMIAATQ